LQNAIQEGFTDLERMIRVKIQEMDKKYPPKSLILKIIFSTPWRLFRQ